jgi:hypothetical protein
MTEDVDKSAPTGAPGEGGDAPPQEEPVITGTLFFTTLLLIMIFGFWAMMYLTLLNR